jgi:hypothetical protein
MIESIELIGSIVGLLTGIFTVYDRYVRGRPIAQISEGIGRRKCSTDSCCGIASGVVEESAIITNRDGSTPNFERRRSHLHELR